MTNQEDNEREVDIMEDEKSWSRWEKFVLAELKGLRSNYREVSNALNELAIQFARFDEKAKASGRLSGAIWGGISGVAILVISEVLNQRLKLK